MARYGSRYLQKVQHWCNYHQNNSIYYGLGTDTGIGSLSIAIIQNNKKGVPLNVSKDFVWEFPSGAIPKTGNTKNSQRRQYRHVYRRLNRKKVSRRWINKIFSHAHILSYQSQRRTLYHHRNFVYKWITHAINGGKLTHRQLYQVVRFLVLRRGYDTQRLNSMTESQQKNAKGSKLAISHTEAMIKKHHEKYLDVFLYHRLQKKLPVRNRHGHLLFMPTRIQRRKELKKVLQIQAHYCSKVSEHFIKECFITFDYQHTYDQGPSYGKYAGGIKKMVSIDPLQPVINHCYNLVIAKDTATFEYFRLLDKLNNVVYRKNLKQYSINTNQRKEIVNYALHHKTLSKKRIAKILGVNLNATNISGTGSFVTMEATADISKILTPKQRTRDLIDQIGTLMAFRKDHQYLVQGLKCIDHNALSTKQIHQFVKLSKKLPCSQFGKFSKSTINKLLPYLEKGVQTQIAEHKAGLMQDWGHKVPVTTQTSAILHRMYHNPIQIRVIHLWLRAIGIIVNTLGRPDYNIIESGRNLKHPENVRQSIMEGQLRNHKRNHQLKQNLRNNDIFPSDKNALKLRLFNQQRGRNIYNNHKFTKNKIFNGDKYAEIDHIMPRGLCYNDGYNNLVLTSAKCNQAKGERLPLQWMKEDPHFNKVDIENYLKRVKKWFGMQIVVTKWKTITKIPARSRQQRKALKDKYHCIKSIAPTVSVKARQRARSKIYQLSSKSKLTASKRSTLKRAKKTLYGAFKVPVKYKPIQEYANLIRLKPLDATKLWQARNAVDNQTISAMLYKFSLRHLHYRNNKYLSKQRTYLSSGWSTHMLRYLLHLNKLRWYSDQHHGVDSILIALSTPVIQQAVNKFYHTSMFDKNGECKTIQLPMKNTKQKIENAAKRIIVCPKSWRYNNTMFPYRDTKYSLKYPEYGIGRRTLVTDLKYRTHHYSQTEQEQMKKNGYPVKKTGRIISYNGSMWRLNRHYSGNTVTDALVSSLTPYLNKKSIPKNKTQRKTGIGSSAFPKGYLTLPNGQKVYQVMLFTPFVPGAIHKAKKELKPYSGIARTDVFYNPSRSKKQQFYLSTVYPLAVRKHWKDKTLDKGQHALDIQGKDERWPFRIHINKHDHYQFSLEQRTPVWIQFKKPREFKFGKNVSYRYKVNPNNVTGIKEIKKKHYQRKITKSYDFQPAIPIDNVVYPAQKFTTYHLTPQRVPAQKNIYAKQNSKQKSFVGRKMYGNTFVGIVRRATSDGSLLIQPFDKVSQASATVTVSMAQIKNIKKLISNNLGGTHYHAI